MFPTTAQHRPGHPVLFRSFGRVLLLSVVLAVAMLGCKKSEPAAATTATSQATPQPTVSDVPRGTSGQTFDPALLEDRFTSRDFMLTLPPVDGQLLRVTLGGKAPYTLALRVAVECTDQESFDELTKRAEPLMGTLTESVQSVDADTARTAAGRLAIKEGIATRLQASMEHKGIRQVYFLEYRIETMR